MHRTILLCAALTTLLAAGCGKRGPETVLDLAAALKAEGLRYEAIETAALPRIQADGRRLRGGGLDVAIYLIEDERDMKRAVAAVAIVSGLTAKGAGAPELGCHVVKPFLVVVHAEPEPGQVAAALKRIFGD